MSEALWSLKWEKGELVLLDQTKLPGNISYIHCRGSREVGEAISRLSAVLRPSGWRRPTAWYWPLRKSKKKGSQALL